MYKIAQNIKILFIASATSAMISSCQSSFYASTYSFNQQYEQRNYDAAITELNNTKLLKKRKRNLVLYYLNYATLLQLKGDYNNSITYFNLADHLIAENNSLTFTDAALAIATNSMKTTYHTESFEQIMLHYYQALNYISINNYEDAIVECKKINEELEKLDDYRKDNGKHYTHDAFGHYIMGILYETIGDNNNAFIAYRNALNIYDGDYTTLYSTPAPASLKTAAIRTAYATGFKQDAQEFEKKYNTIYKANNNTGHLIVLIEDGNSPVKTEHLFNFTKGSGNGVLTYASDDGSINVPVFLPQKSAQDASLSDIKTITMTLPKYTLRTKQLPSSNYNIDGRIYMASTVENLNKIAPQSLKDRYWRELGTAILRVGAKQALSSAVSKQNELAGLAISVTQAFSEKADTRNWQTLPACIRIIDIEIEAGTHTITLPQGKNISVSVEKGKTAFLTIKN